MAPVPQIPTAISQAIEQSSADASGQNSARLQQTVARITPQQVASLAPLQGTPLIRSLPNTTGRFERKYAGTTPESFGLTPGQEALYGAMRSLDMQRAKAGSMPLSDQQTVDALKAARDRKPVTPEPERSLYDVPGNAISDLTDIVKSIPRIPGAIVSEGKRLLDLPAEIAKMDSLSDVTRLPGVNLIPGAYTAGNVLDGKEGLREAVTHPLMTALDVLPGAKAAAEGTQVAKLATELAADTERINPLTTVALKKVAAGPDGPQLVNRALGNAAEMVADTRVGQAWTQAFGQRTRNTVQPVAVAANELQDLITSGKPIPAKYTNLSPLIESSRELNGIFAETGGVGKKFDLTPDDIAGISRDMQVNPDKLFEPRATLDDPLVPRADLPDNTQAYLSTALQHRTQIDQFMKGEQMLVEHAGELYLPADAAMLGQIQKSFLRKFGSYTTRADKMFAKYVDYKSAGYSTVGKFENALASGAAHWDDFADQLPEQVADLFAAHQQYASQPTAANLLELKKVANQKAKGRTLIGSAGAVGPAANPSGVTALGEFANFRNDIAGMQKVHKRFDNSTANYIPARFETKISDKAARDYIEYKFGSSDELRDQAIGLWEDGLLKTMDGYSAKTIRSKDPLTGKTVVEKGHLDFIKDVAPTWKEMRDAGFDPVYVHRVAPDAAERMAFPKPGVTNMTPSNLKKRSLDMAPTVRDVMVTMQHEAVQMLTDRVTDDLIATVADKTSVPRQSVVDTHMAEARRLAELDPRGGDVAAYLDKIIAKKYEPYDPGAMFTGQKPTTTLSDQTPMLIRRTDASALRQIFAKNKSGLMGAVDPLTGIMRTSLLALSPRWHVYNVLGGAIMLQAQSGWGVWKNAPDAFKAIRAASKGEVTALSDLGLPDQFVSSLGGMERDAAIMQYRSGATMRRLFNEARYGRGTPEALAAMELPKEPGALKSGFDKFVGKSFEANQFIDDAYRTMAYLDGHDQALTKGMSREDAVTMGMKRASKVLQDMTELTPFESQILRNIFPFYNFYQHVMRYAVQYPIDHPLRIAVTAGFARNEIDSLGGMPHQMLEAFTWGEPDAQGNRSGMSLAGLNPFSSTASLFQLSGWLGSLNPIGKTVAEQLGIDTQSGQPELFPQLGYDPQTGNMSIQSDNPLIQLAANTMPQSQLVAELLGVSGEFKRLQRTDPAAAQRMLASQAGLPILFRSYNPDQKRMKAETQRGIDLKAQAKDLLKAGDINTLTTDPRFADVAAKLATLQESGGLENYQPNVYAPSLQQQLTGGLFNQFGYEAISPEETDAYNAQIQVAASTPGNARVTT